MNFVHKLATVIYLLFAATVAHSQDTSLPSTLRIGIIPNVTTNVLMANYSPLKSFFLEQGFTKVDLVSTVDFQTFNEQTKLQQFDLIVTAPHMARLAQIDYKYEPLVAMTPNIRALLIAAQEEKATLETGKNFPIAFANPQSLVAMIGNKWLASKNFRSGSDFTQVVVPREDNIGRLVTEGTAKFGILSNAELRAVPALFQSKLKVVEVMAEIPNFVILSNANFSKAQNLKLLDMFKTFADKNEFGEQFFKLSGYLALRPVTENQMKSLDAYLVQTRTAFATN